MTTKSITVADAKKEFAETINRVAHSKERIILTRRGKDIAALIPIDDLILLEASQNKSDLQQAIEALEEGRNQGMETLEQLQHELDNRK